MRRHADSSHLPEQQLDVGVVVHEHEGGVIAQEEVECGDGLRTLHGMEAPARVRNVEVTSERLVMLQYHADSLGVHPLLPENKMLT